MGLGNDIKSLIVKENLTITKVADELNRLNNTDLTVQNLANKLKKDNLRYKEVEQILDIVGYSIDWTKKTAQ